MSEDPILQQIGLTKAQVERLTSDMRLDFRSIRAASDPLQDFIWVQVRKWRSLRLHDLSAVARVAPTKMAATVRHMAAAGIPIGMEDVADGEGSSIFVCLSELVTTENLA